MTPVISLLKTFSVFFYPSVHVSLNCNATELEILQDMNVNLYLELHFFESYEIYKNSNFPATSMWWNLVKFGKVSHAS